MNACRFLILCFIIFNVSYAVENTIDNKLIPYYRRVEEIEDKSFTESKETDESQNNIVSFLVENVKEIFDDIVSKSDYRTVSITLKHSFDDFPKNIIKSKPTVTKSMTNVMTNPITKAMIISKTKLTFKPTTKVTRTKPIATTKFTILPNSSKTDKDKFTYDYPNTSLTTTVYPLTRELFISYVQYESYKENTTTDFVSANMNGTPKTSKIGATDKTPAMKIERFENEQDLRKSCIMCNNVNSVDCNNPQSKLIPSIVCNNNDDVCYTMHTPFGIVDRGCFNSDTNMTTYICSCNLCNHLSISELPFWFPTKHDWVDNIIESSRSKRLKFVHEDMSCLKCEVNMTQYVGGVRFSTNCLEGTAGDLPTEVCKEDEVCAIKSVRSEGYIWRGCIKSPLYNYWWSFCNTDLCNYEPLISLYDFF